MKRQTVILDIAYDENQFDAPSQWDWAELLDIAPELVTLVLTGVLINTEEA